jgi:putative endopeptidase
MRLSLSNTQKTPLALAFTLLLSACQSPQPQAVAEAPKSEVPPAAPVKLVIDEGVLPVGFSLKASDRGSVAACADLNAHINQRWIDANPIPADRTTWGSFEMLDERSFGVQKQIAEQLVARSTTSGVEKLVADFYATGMDIASINALGIKPLERDLAAIAALQTPADLRVHLRRRQCVWHWRRI